MFSTCVLVYLINWLNYGLGVCMVEITEQTHGNSESTDICLLQQNKNTKEMLMISSTVYASALQLIISKNQSMAD